MAQTPSYLQRDAANWYMHGTITDGYTNENQIIGAGSGFFNHGVSLVFSLVKTRSVIGQGHAGARAVDLEFGELVAQSTRADAQLVRSFHAAEGGLDGGHDQLVFVGLDGFLQAGAVFGVRAGGRCGRPKRTGWRRLPDGSFETTVAPEGKLDMLSRLLAEPGGLAKVLSVRRRFRPSRGLRPRS